MKTLSVSIAAILVWSATAHAQWRVRMVPPGPYYWGTYRNWGFNSAGRYYNPGYYRNWQWRGW